MSSAKIEDCTLIELILIESKFESLHELKNCKNAEVSLEHRIEFDDSDDSDNSDDRRTFVLYIKSSIEAKDKGDGNVLFSASCKYKASFFVDGDDSVDLVDYAPFSDQLGKKIYLTVRDHLHGLLLQGKIPAFLPFELPTEVEEHDEEEE